MVRFGGILLFGIVLLGIPLLAFGKPCMETTLVGQWERAGSKSEYSLTFSEDGLVTCVGNCEHQGLLAWSIEEGEETFFVHDRAGKTKWGCQIEASGKILAIRIVRKGISGERTFRRVED